MSRQAAIRRMEAAVNRTWMWLAVGLGGSFAIGGLVFLAFEPPVLTTIALALTAWLPWVVSSIRLQKAIGVVRATNDAAEASFHIEQE